MRVWCAALVAGALACVPATALAQAPVLPVDPATAPAPGVVATGVSIAGIPVGGLSGVDATRAVIAQHVVPRRAPLRVTFRGRNLVINPVAAGYVADVAYAVEVALIYGRTRGVPAEGVDVPLREKINRARLRAILSRRAATHDLPARDATLSLRGVTPVVRKPRLGIAIDVARSETIVAAAIIARDRPAYALASRRVAPAVRSAPTVVVVDRGAFRVTVWKGTTKRASFPVAVGTSTYPTPSGNFRVIQKQKNPTWYPPDSRWAEGLGPVPPGSGNPLGTRWIGTSAPAIGLHGTPSSYSIGTRASHGCIRMYIGDAERIYEMVEVGTPVYIR